MRESLEAIFYGYLVGDYESVKRWVWVYVHLGIFLTMALIGYSVAEGRYLLAAALVPIPGVYLLLRYRDAGKPR